MDLFDFGEVEFARERFKENDLFVAISLSGESSEAIRVMRLLQGTEIRTLSLTRWANNSLPRMCQEKSVCGDSYRLSDGERVLRDGSGILYIAGYSDSPVSGIRQSRQKQDTGATGKGAVRSGGRIEELLNSRYDSFSENEKYICIT